MFFKMPKFDLLIIYQKKSLNTIKKILDIFEILGIYSHFFKKKIKDRVMKLKFSGVVRM